MYNPGLSHPHFTTLVHASMYNPAHLHPPLGPDAPAALTQHIWGLNQVWMALALAPTTPVRASM